MVPDRTDVMCDHVTNDHRCILLDEAAVFRHMTSQLFDVLRGLKHVLDNFGTFLVCRQSQTIVQECIISRIDGTQLVVFH